MQRRQVCVKKEYDEDKEEEDKNEDDWVLIINRERIRPHDGKNRRELVHNQQDRGVDGNLENIKMQIPVFQGEMFLKLTLNGRRR